MKADPAIRSRFLIRYLPALVFLAAFAQYANTIRHEYAWDDKLVITANEYTQKGIAGLPEIFAKRVSVPYKDVYRPLPQALFAIEYDLFQKNPHAGHLFSVLWYALACVVVYLFVRFLFPRAHPVFAFASALLYTVHPLHVEVVANIKSRDETLALLFGLSGVMWSVRSMEENKWRLAVPAILCFAFAFLSKENAVTLMPVALVALWFRSDNIRPARKFYLLTAIICIVLLAIWLAGKSKEPVGHGAMQLDSTVLNNIFLWTTEPDKVFPTALVNIGRYLQLFYYPHPLVHLYGYDQISLKGWGDPETWAIVMLLAGVAVYMAKTRREKNPIHFGIALFALTYSIYSNIFVLAPDTMADRYMFIPSLGLAMITVALLFKIGKLDINKPACKGWRCRLAVALFGIMATGFFIRTFAGNRDWHDDSSLIKNRIVYMENNAAAQATYGFILIRESSDAADPAMRLALKRKGMQAYLRAIEIYPDFPWAWISAGKIFAEEGMYEKAELAFIKGQQLEPLSPDGYYCLGSLYYTLRESVLAINYLEKAVLLNPQMEEAYVMLGKAYLQNNDVENLASLSETGQKWFPANGEFDAFRAACYFRRGSINEAYALAQTALQKTPGNLLAMSIISSIRRD